MGVLDLGELGLDSLRSGWKSDVRRPDQRVLPHYGGNQRTNGRRLMRSSLWAADLVLLGDCEKRDGHGQLSRAEDYCGKLTTSFSTTKASET